MVKQPTFRVSWSHLLVILVCAVEGMGCCSQAPYEGKSVAQLERMLRSADPKVQAQGAFGMSLLKEKAREAVPALAEALHNPDTLVRQNAALALGTSGAVEAVPSLMEALQDPEWTVRRQAAYGLGQLGPLARASLPALKKLSQDLDSLVKRTALEAIQKVGEE